MSDIVERLHTLARGDHDRNCQGREYHCGCGFDEQAWQAADDAADTITNLRAELAEARDKALDEAAKAMENLSFFIDVSELIGMTKQEMSERTCHEGAQAIRALKSPKPQSALSDLIASTADEYDLPPIL